MNPVTGRRELKLSSVAGYACLLFLSIWARLPGALGGHVRDVVPGQRLVETVDGMAVGDAGKDVGEIGLRVDAVQFRGLDQ